MLLLPHQILQQFEVDLKHHNQYHHLIIELPLKHHKIYYHLILVSVFEHHLLISLYRLLESRGLLKQINFEIVVFFLIFDLLLIFYQHVFVEQKSDFLLQCYLYLLELYLQFRFDFLNYIRLFFVFLALYLSVLEINWLRFSTPLSLPYFAHASLAFMFLYSTNLPKPPIFLIGDFNMK